MRVCLDLKTIAQLFDGENVEKKFFREYTTKRVHVRRGLLFPYSSSQPYYSMLQLPVWQDIVF